MATSAQYAEWIVKNAAKKGTPEFDIVAKAYADSRSAEPASVQEAPSQATPEPQSPAPQTADWKDLAVATPSARLLAGAVSPVVGAAQLGVNVGDWVTEKMGGKPVAGQWVADQIKRYEESKQRGMDALAGQPGQTDIAGALGTVASGAGMVSRIPAAGSWAMRVAQGGAVGAGMGAVTPSVTPNQTGKNMLIGGALGGGVPAAAPLVGSNAK